MPRIATLFAACLALGLSAAASAGEIGTNPVLRVDQGRILTSDGGAFVPSVTGAVLDEETRLMVVEGASATVVYDNGCTRVYDTPGIFVIAAQCSSAAAVANVSRGAGSSALVIAAAAGVGAALLESQPETPAPPISR